MVFKKDELDLAKIASETISERDNLFDFLCDKEYDNIGLEGWLQIELIKSYSDEGYKVIMKGKVKQGCDLIVRTDIEDILVELRTIPTSNYKTLNEAIRAHPEADVYIFLARYDLDKLRDYELSFCDKIGYEIKSYPVGNWLILLVKKRP